MEAATPKLNTFVHYAKVELVPPTPGELGAAAAGLGNIMKSVKTGAWRNLTVKVSFPLSNRVVIEYLSDVPL